MLLLSFAQHRLGQAEAVDSNRNAAVDSNLREHRAYLVRGKTVALRATHVRLKFFHLAESGDHAEVEDGPLAGAERLVTPRFAPAVLGNNALKVAVKIVGALERSVDVVLTQHLAAHGKPAVISILVHGYSSDLP